MPENVFVPEIPEHPPSPCGPILRYLFPSGERVRIELDGGGLLAVGTRTFRLRVQVSGDVQPAGVVQEVWRNRKVLYQVNGGGRPVSSFRKALFSAYALYTEREP